MSSTEFDIIRRYFGSQPIQRQDVPLGIGDDAALLAPPAKHELVVTSDTLVAGIHFLTDIAPQALGYKALAVNLSDLAAMGATPAWVTLALTLPKADEDWLTGFARGFFSLAQEFDVQLVGGDTTRGPLSITVQAMGFVPQGEAVTRGGAKPGDVVCVSGTLGDAAAGLALSQGRLSATDPDARELVRRLERPAPRLALGQALRGLATAAIDVSDGLAADLGHILQSSKVGADINIEDLPLSMAFRSLQLEPSWQLAVTGGDDYELCFTLPLEGLTELEGRVAGGNCPITRIGRITARSGVRWHDSQGERCELIETGYDHFSTNSDANSHG